MDPEETPQPSCSPSDNDYYSTTSQSISIRDLKVKKKRRVQQNRIVVTQHLSDAAADQEQKVSESPVEVTCNSFIYTQVLQVALPNIFNYVLMTMIEVVSNMFIGNLDEPVRLAGIGLASYTVNMIGLIVSFGLNSTLEELIGEAIKQNNRELCVQYRNQAMLLVTVFLLPMMTGIDPLEYLLKYLFKQDEVAELYHQYVYMFIPMAYLSCLCDCQIKYLSQFQ